MPGEVLIDETSSEFHRAHVRRAGLPFLAVGVYHYERNATKSYNAVIGRKSGLKHMVNVTQTQLATSSARTSWYRALDLHHGIFAQCWRNIRSGFYGGLDCLVWPRKTNRSRDLQERNTTDDLNPDGH